MSMKNIRDASGRIIQTIVTNGDGFTNVSDGRGRPLGYSTANGTFNERGELVTWEPKQFGLLSRDDDD